MRLRRPLRTIWNVLVRRAPVEAQLVVTRRCNLSCGYCNEYDAESAPIPLSLLKERIDALHRLGTAAITISGGEPLLHPDLPGIVAHARKGSMACLITNGFLLTETIIERLNDAGLDHIQISVDALEPTADLYIQKSLKSLRRQLRLVREHAKFDVHVNAVLSPQSIDRFSELIDEIRDVGLVMSVGIMHDEHGRVAVQGQKYVDAWEEFYSGGHQFSAIEREYGANLLRGTAADWHCRAGARYLYIDEFGKAQFCASQRGRMDIDVTRLTRADLAENYHRKKGCETGCTVSCAYRVSAIDNHPVETAKSWVQGGRHSLTLLG